MCGRDVDILRTRIIGCERQFYFPPLCSNFCGNSQDARMRWGWRRMIWVSGIRKREEKEEKEEGEEGKSSLLSVVGGKMKVTIVCCHIQGTSLLPVLSVLWSALWRGWICDETCTRSFLSVDLGVFWKNLTIVSSILPCFGSLCLPSSTQVNVIEFLKGITTAP